MLGVRRRCPARLFDEGAGIGLIDQIKCIVGDGGLGQQDRLMPQAKLAAKVVAVQRRAPVVTPAQCGTDLPFRQGAEHSIVQWPRVFQAG
ncbi:hypothetical protein D3C79_978250 [compost metagenome]